MSNTENQLFNNPDRRVRTRRGVLPADLQGDPTPGNVVKRKIIDKSQIYSLEQLIMFTENKYRRESAREKV